MKMVVGVAERSKRSFHDDRDCMTCVQLRPRRVVVSLDKMFYDDFDLEQLAINRKTWEMNANEMQLQCGFV